MSHDAIPEMALAWVRAGRGAALATVIETWGSAPRQPGSQLAISGDGQIMGSVSGGCVEGAVVVEALEAMADGVPRVLSFGVTDETAFSVGLACGGTIRVLVEPVAPWVDLLAELVAIRAARGAVGYVVDLGDWSRALILPDVDTAVDGCLRQDKAAIDGARFIVPHNPPLRLIVVGAVHIAQSLVSMARLAGYDPVVIDPRETFGAQARFPGEVVLDEWPDEALARLAPDARTAIVTLTHDAKLDDPAIKFALGSGCFYLGCLGSKKTHAARVERLLQAGFSEAQIGRIHAPVGLNIGAKTPAEIAISILAQMTAVLRGA
jgi:xanthine dehydrogenase accessory factor